MSAPTYTEREMSVVGRTVARLRLRVASWAFGHEWYGVVMRLWLIRERAMAAVKQDGDVVLANCQALADALYEPVPGTWRLTLALLDDGAAAGGDV